MYVMADVLPSSQELISEDAVVSVQQNMIVTISEQVEGFVMEKNRPETLLCQNPLHLDAPSATDHAKSSDTMMMRCDRSLRRSLSLNPDWKLGDSWLTLRHEKGTALQSRFGASSVTSITGTRQQDREIQGAANSNDDEAKKSSIYMLKKWRHGELWETRGNGNDVKFSDSQGLENSSTSEIVNRITSPCHLDYVSDATRMSTDAPCMDLYAFFY